LPGSSTTPETREAAVAIASQLGTSTRTVHKHLEHVYVKLGVETRTAAVMRALDLRPPDGTELRRVAERSGAARRGPGS